MAEGKNIEIKILATGGDQAAAEVRKPAEAAVEAHKTLQQQMEDRTKGVRFDDPGASYRAEQEAARMAVLAHNAAAMEEAAQVRIERSAAAAAAAATKITQAGVQMGTGWRNVGYQVQDVAVQIGAGTSAMVSLGQQAPQLLSGFGPWGILLGTISAIAFPLAGALFKMGDAAESAGDKADDAAPKLKKLQEAAGEIAARKSAAELQEWLDALDDEDQAYRDQNVILTRNVELLTLRRTAQLGVDSAQREAEIAKIQADPKKSDADKIRETAAIREDDIKAQAQEKLDDLADKRRTEKQKQDLAMEDGLRAKEDEVAASSRKRALETEKVELTRNVAAADKAKEALPVQVAAENDARTIQFAAASERYSPEDQAKLKAQYEGLKKQREATEAKSNSVTTADRARLSGGDIEDEIKRASETQAAAAAKKKEAEDRARSARDAGRKAEEIQNIQAPAIIQQYASGRDARSVTTDAAVRKAEAEKAAKKLDEDKKADDEKRKGRGEDLENKRDAAESGLNANARQGGLQARNQGLKSGNETLAKIGKELSDGTNAAEIQKLGDLVKEKQGELGASMVAALQKLLSSLDGQAKQIEVIKGQIKNNRNGR